MRDIICLWEEMCKLGPTNDAETVVFLASVQLHNLLPPLILHKAGSNEELLGFGSELYRIQIQLEGEFLSASLRGTFHIADVWGSRSPQSV